MIELLEPGDPRTPGAGSCVLERMLETQAATMPDAILVRFADGAEWTYAEVLKRATETARALQNRGVKPGDRVVLWLPNGPEAVQAVYGCAFAGVVCVPISIAYKGSVLEHVLTNSEAKIAIVHRELLPRLSKVKVPLLSAVIVTSGNGDLVDGLQVVTWDDAHAGLPTDLVGSQRKPTDPFAVIYTSGTTGRSKGVVCSSVHIYSFMTANPVIRERPGDRALMTAPISHMTGMGAIYRVVLFGSSMAIVNRFETARFWETVAETGATMALLVGAQCSYLVQAPPSDASVGHSLRQVGGSPVTEDFVEFGRRFGVEMVTGFAMTEIPSPLVSGPNPTVFGSCGRVREGAEVRLIDVDGHDVEVGQTGELLVRMTRPYAAMTEYLGMPDETAQAWQDGWFHTGDTLRADAEGNFYFVDRVKDALRSRGENISSFDVEAALMAHPSIALAAAIGVPNLTGDQDLLAVVQLEPGGSMDEVELIEAMTERLPSFMVPRYVRVVEEFPMTATQRIQKHLLREVGVTPDTWDRVAAGIRVESERL